MTLRPDRPTLPTWLALAMLMLIVMAAFAGHVWGAEAKDSSVLYIYTDPAHCAPCRLLDKSLDRPPMNQFKVVRLPPPYGCSIPCIAYWKANFRPAYFIGWSGKESESKFLEQWRKDTQK